MRLLTVYERGYKVGLGYAARFHLGNTLEKNAIISEYFDIVEEMRKKRVLDGIAECRGLLAGWTVGIW